jgi:hypothetical protein
VGTLGLDGRDSEWADHHVIDVAGREVKVADDTASGTAQTAEFLGGPLLGVRCPTHPSPFWICHLGVDRREGHEHTNANSERHQPDLRVGDQRHQRREGGGERHPAEQSESDVPPVAAEHEPLPRASLHP